MQPLKIILVGNGPSLLEKEMGSKIDEYNIVIRFNKYEIKGYEIQVGQKTDIWCLDTGHFLKLFNQKNLRDFKEIWMLPSSRESHDTKETIKQLQLSKCKYFVGTRKFASELQDRIGSFPTTGINAIETAINLFGQVNLIGFDGTRKNYFPERIPMGQNPHDMRKETKYIIRLIEQGWIKQI